MSSTSTCGCSPATQLRAASSRPGCGAARVCRTSAPLLGLKAQLGSMGNDAEDVKMPELSEELMLVLALQAQKKKAVAPGSNLIVFGALDRLGQVVVRAIAKDGRYKAYVQTYEGYEKDMRWRIDNIDKEETFPPEAKVIYNRLPGDVKAAILCVEGATDVDKLKAVLGAGMGIQRFILVTRGGTELRETDWKLKLNPFLQLDKWNLLEETLKEYAETADWDYTIIRAGSLRGGPFFNTNVQFDQALEDRIFDGEMVGVVLKKGDQDGSTGRDLLAQCILECLARPETANKIISVTSHKMFREDGVKCSVENQIEVPPDLRKDGSPGRPRQVYTPSKEEWAKAFERAKI